MPKSRTRSSASRAPSTGGEGTCEGPCRIEGGRRRSLKASQTSVATSCEMPSAGTITFFWAAITITAWLFSLAISRTTVRWPSSAANTTVQTSRTSFTGAENVCSTAIWSMMLPLAMPTSRGLTSVNRTHDALQATSRVNERGWRLLRPLTPSRCCLRGLDFIQKPLG